ncbi:MAG: hypothetical protein K2X35_11100 [Bryobacteraceae bacterium]|nr:hypothetical protein [Bryobacteraceae bacterium]
MGRTAAIVILAAFVWCTSAACYAQPCRPKSSCSRSKPKKQAPPKVSNGCEFLSEEKWQDEVVLRPDLFPPTAATPAPALRASRLPEPRARGDDSNALLHFIQVLRI